MTLQHRHVISLIHPDNRRSIALAERLGERLEGTTEICGRPVLTMGSETTNDAFTPVT